WPAAEAQFRTSQPFAFQQGAVIVGLALVNLVLAAVFAPVAGWALVELPHGGGAPGGRAHDHHARLGLALACGAFAGGVLAALGALDALLLRDEPRAVPGVLGALAALAAIRGIARHAYPDAALGGMLELVAIALVMLAWQRWSASDPT